VLITRILNMHKTIFRQRSLSYWEEHINNCHSKDMDFTLDRVHKVAKLAKLLKPKAKIITVAGTNGKGTSCAFLSQILIHYGKSVGVFSSPHLFKINERFNINGKLVSDDVLSAAFSFIDNIRGEIKLTYFEFCTLAAFKLFKEAKCDIWILEVGLGGRLDSTNILDADIALLISIDLDHTNILGDSREKIAQEKIGVFRKNQIIICGDNNPPDIVKQRALDLNAKFYCADIDYNSQDLINIYNKASIPISNSAAVKMLLKAAFFDIYKRDDFKSIFKYKMDKFKLLGRMTKLDSKITRLRSSMICDGAHNPHAARHLAQCLKQYLDNKNMKLHFVFSAFADKNILGILAPVLKLSSGYDSNWYLYEMDHPRSESLDNLKNKLKNNFDKINQVFSIENNNVKLLHDTLKQEVGSEDLVVVFGSFYLLGRVFEYFNIY
jgi:dihydrofolate synthase / folylpolyglutamate synthase